MSAATVCPAAVRGSAVGNATRASTRRVATPVALGCQRQRDAAVATRVVARRAATRATPRGSSLVVRAAHYEAAQVISDLAAGVGLPCTVRPPTLLDDVTAHPGPALRASARSLFPPSPRPPPARARPRLTPNPIPIPPPDPKLRRSDLPIHPGRQPSRRDPPLFTPIGLSLLTILGLYLTATPGVLGGFVDYYILRPLLGQRSYSIDDFILGPKLGEGGFGVVYRATGVEDGEEYVLKRCKDYGEAEIWTNSRLMRACPDAIASYRGAFYGPKDGKTKTLATEGSIWKRAKKAAIGSDDEEDLLWIVWKYEGSDTLANLMNDKDFPYNVEPFLFKNQGGIAIEGEPRGTRRKAKIISTIFGQILENLSKAHATGIILRDVKPENMIFDPEKAKFKLIDLGAAADLRFGFNYQPKEFILDPRFSGPEEYIMSTQTPEAPPTPVALALSPALWQLNVPDRFDSYSAGVTLLQMCIPSLRSDNNLIAFRRTLEENGESLTDWRNKLPARVTSKGPDAEGFDVLDADDRAGWDLVKSLMNKTREKRSSATGARLSRFVQGKNPVVQILDGAFGRSPDEDEAEAGGLWAWLVFRVARSGTNREGGFTEAQLSAFREEGDIEKTEEASKYLGYVATETLAKYGVDTVPRTVAGDSLQKQKRDEDDGDEGAGKQPAFNPFQAINDNLQKLTNRD